MAWRIHENVLRGEIDNRTRGRVTGRVWLAGVEQPLVLELRGDCEPDLAGCTLRFENPMPLPLTTRPPAFTQRGAAVEITAARKVRVFDIPVEEAYAMIKAGGTPPEHVANALYLEWETELSGCVIIESTGYRLEISEPAWRFTDEEIAEKKRRATEAAEDAPFASELRDEGSEEPWDEFRSEQFLRENDARTERYGRLLEKYHDHPDSERIIAREMGWTWLEEALDEQERAAAAGEESAAGEEPVDEDDEALSDEAELDAPDPQREGIDWVRDERGDVVHPIKKRATDALHRLLDELKAGGKFPDCKDEQLGEFVGHFMNASAKLAGALGSVARGYDFGEPGLTIARLKRILEILNDTLTAADAVAKKPLLLAPDRLAQCRAELFGIREDILALVARLRGTTE